MAHWEEESARKCGRRALALYATAPPEVRRHPVVRQLCKPGSPGCAQLTRFCRREATLLDCDIVFALCGRYRFAPVCERWVEGQHASTKKHLYNAPHHSCVHVAWRNIHGRLAAEFEKEPELLTKFADICPTVKNPRRALSFRY